MFIKVRIYNLDVRFFEYLQTDIKNNKLNITKQHMVKYINGEGAEEFGDISKPGSEFIICCLI